MKSVLPILLLFLSVLVYPQSASVISENANLRGTASAYGKVVTTLPSGSVVEVIKQKGPWFLVQSPDYAGWLHGDTIRMNGSVFSGLRLSSPVYVSKPTPEYVPRSDSRSYIRGPRGGCYYINSNGNKTYVDRSLCN